jgi:hypothetical protein
VIDGPIHPTPIMRDVHVLFGGVVCLGGSMYVSGVVLGLRAAVAGRVVKRQAIPEDRRELVAKMQRGAGHWGPRFE